MRCFLRVACRGGLSQGLFLATLTASGCDRAPAHLLLCVEPGKQNLLDPWDAKGAYV